MRKDDSVYLRHVLDAICRIEEYTQDITHEDFLHNHLRQDGVIRQNIPQLKDEIRAIIETIT